MKIEDVPIERIIVGERFRRDLGDIDALAANIADVGLLEPIGVDADYRLIFGDRRLRACRILQWEAIPCVILSLQSILEGEYAENELRKQFTTSERVAIGTAIKAELLSTERRGNPLFSAIAENREHGNSVDIAATRAGFNSAETFERASSVVENGIPELRDAMDSHEISVDAAALIATQPEPEQRRIVRKNRAERRADVRMLRRQAAARKRQTDSAQVSLRRFSTFRKLAESVRFLAEFALDSDRAWSGVWEAGEGDGFLDNLQRAQICLARLEQERPNAKRRGPVLGFRKGEVSS